MLPMTSREIKARKACQNMLQGVPPARLVDALVSLAARLNPEAKALALQSHVAVAVVHAMNHAEQVAPGRLLDALRVPGV